MIRAEITNDLDFSGYTDILQKEINKELHVIGRFLVKYAQNTHRYQNRTGNLKESTRFWVDKAKARVRLYISESRAEYGKFVHEGHGTWSADRFIDNAIVRNKEYIDERMQEAISRAAKEFNRKNRM